MLVSDLMLEKLRYLSEVLHHPLNAGRRLSTLSRCARWFIGARLLDVEIVMPFVNETTLLMKRGMRGLTENVYVGLSEFEDMAFVLHMLRDRDVFVDVGANAGAYTILASGVVGAKSIAFEPLPVTYAQLLRSVALNGIAERVDARNKAVGRSAGLAQMTVGLDAANHITALEGTGTEIMEVPVVTLDDALSANEPTLIKIDVEGYEAEVIAGAEQTLRRQSLLAVILETNDCADRYGADPRSLDARMLAHGFERSRYDPFTRVLRPGEISEKLLGRNTLYVRDAAMVQARLTAATPFHVNGHSL